MRKLLLLLMLVLCAGCEKKDVFVIDKAAKDPNDVSFQYTCDCGQRIMVCFNRTWDNNSFNDGVFDVECAGCNKVQHFDLLGKEKEQVDVVAHTSMVDNEANMYDATISSPETHEYAIEATHSDTPIKWVVPTFEDLSKCTDEELLNISIFCTIGKSTRTAEDFIYFGDKFMPKRFKVEPVSFAAECKEMNEPNEQIADEGYSYDTITIYSPEAYAIEATHSAWIIRDENGHIYDFGGDPCVLARMIKSHTEERKRKHHPELAELKRIRELLEEPINSNDMDFLQFDSCGGYIAKGKETDKPIDEDWVISINDLNDINSIAVQRNGEEKIFTPLEFFTRLGFDVENGGSIPNLYVSKVDEPCEITISEPSCDEACCPYCKIPTDRMILGGRSDLVYRPVILTSDGTTETTGHNSSVTDYKCLKCGKEYSI